jgi:hypothetical protein
VVEAKDLVTGDKAVVLRNAGSRYQVEVEDFTTGNTLPKFFLIFTEFESERFLFHTTWQWEVGMWRERASSVWDALTLELLDWEVPATIYAEEKKELTRHGSFSREQADWEPWSHGRARDTRGGTLHLQ